MSRPDTFREAGRGLARIIGATVLATALALGATGCAPVDPEIASKSVGDLPAGEEPAAAELEAAAEAEAEIRTQEVPQDVAEQMLGYPWDIDEQHPVMHMGIETEVALERYAYSTDRGNKVCEAEFDRPAFSIAAGQKAWFCLEPGGGKNDSANVNVDVTYKIVGDPEGRTVWMRSIAPQVGYNQIMCAVKKADRKTWDDDAPYDCEVSFGGDRHSYFPGPYIHLKKK